MPHVIKTLSERRSDLRVELVDADHLVIQRLIEGGELDAGFGYLFTRTAGVHKQPLFSDPLTMVVPRDHYPQCQRMHRPEGWAATREATLIVLHKSNPLMPLINDFLTDAEAPDFRRMEVWHLATVLNMVAAGVGIAVVPASTLIAEQSRRVRPMPLGADPPAIEHCCLTKAGAGEVEGLDEFAELFSLTFQECMARARKIHAAD
jgi:DNA-binding transcriptional LysR family regulator